jgi:hypothetical protein
MALNPSGAISLGGPVTGESIAVELGLSPTASISLNGTDVRTLAQVPSGVIVMPTDFYGKSSITGTQRAIFGFGFRTSPTPAINVAVTNLVSNTGVVSTDTPGVGTARQSLAAAGYGGDKAIFGFGAAPGNTNITNLVSNTGVVAADSPGVGTARQQLAAAGYGGDKAIFGFGNTNITNLVSNTGVVAADSPGVGSFRRNLAAAGYGGDKAIFGFGFRTSPTPAIVVSVTNLVSNTGVVSTDTPGVGTARQSLAAAGYGGDKAIFGFGAAPGTGNTNITNLVSNTGVVAADSPGVGSFRRNLAAAGYSFT